MALAIILMLDSTQRHQLTYYENNDHSNLITNTITRHLCVSDRILFIKVLLFSEKKKLF
jgi:hypothetical protein